LRKQYKQKKEEGNSEIMVIENGRKEEINEKRMNKIMN
jgi:hypothetical protein